jgi:hypothetical protein
MPTFASDVVVVRSDGSLVRTLSICEDLGNNAVMRIGWLDEKRVWIEGHRNPSNGSTCVWSIQDGKRIEVHEGGMFTPSPDGSRIAELEVIPHHAPAWLHPRILIDGKLVYPSRGAAGDFSHLVWSRDSSLLAFIEFLDDRQQVVVISGQGHLWNRTIIAGERVTDLEWSGSRSLIVHQGEGHQRLSIR